MTLGTRLIGVPLAVTLAVVVPLVIVRPSPEPVTVQVQPAQTTTSAQQTTTSQPQPQSKPEPKTAAVKWRISGEIGGPSAAFLALRAAGEPPAKSVLVDETGLHSATLTRAAKPANCPRPPRRTGFGEQVWCLVTSHLDAGHELTGTVDGKGTKLTLTLDRKNAFFDTSNAFFGRKNPLWCGSPFWVLLGGLVAALIVAIWPGRLKTRVQDVQLNELLKKNEKEKRLDRKIICLRAWVDDQLANNAEHSAVWATAGRVISTGPTRATDARAKLKAELDETNKDVPQDLPYIQAAWVEQARTDHKADDFLTKDGKQRDAHPAAEFDAGVKKIAAYLRDLTKLERQVTIDLVETCQKPCLRRIEQARLMLGFVQTTNDLANLDDELWESETAYAEAYSQETCRTVRERATEPAALAFESRGIAAEPLGLTDAGLMGSRAWALFVTALSIGIAFAFAGVTVYEAAYAPNNTFATKEDYFKLFSAALASGVAATIVAFIGYWRPPKSAGAAST